MRILITGCSGLFGEDLQKILGGRHISRGMRGRTDFPLTDSSRIMEIVAGEEPDLIVHSAACRDIDFCEKNPKDAFQVNSLGTRNVVMAAARVGAKFVYISSDLVFSGKKRRAYYEFERPDPDSIYGWSKWWGEYYVQQVIREHIIVRVPLLFGLGGCRESNLIMQAVDQTRNGEKIYAHTERITNPTWTVHAAEVISDLIAAEMYGTFHVGNTGLASTYQLLTAVLEEEGLDPGAIVPVEPGESRYNIIQSAALPYSPGIRPLPNWRDALKICMSSVSYPMLR